MSVLAFQPCHPRSVGGEVIIVIGQPPLVKKSTLFNEGDTQQSSTDKPVAFEFPIELEFRNVGFMFVHGLGQKSEQKHSTKNLVGFHNHFPLLTMFTSILWISVFSNV